ncbi:magnesium transporter [Aquisalimonas asiatica]|uniref:Magnesium transporter MgtE n=1 Tax=Aquisalimonas asiatica TaxID=406100 RepID=A0A1H8S4U6_9GAMM|nr:magnesium transporter [Aquisalimonas asiatica]SEO73622.1 magnesium transporter [Aquisalimonas asiatica]
MEKTELIEQTISLYRGEHWDALDSHLELMAVQDIAEALTELESGEATGLLQRLPQDRRPSVFAYASPATQLGILKELDDEDGRFILYHLLPDDRTAVLERLEPDDLQSMLRLLSPENVKEALRLLGYPEESAGRIMTPSFLTVRAGWTVEHALKHVREHSTAGETVNVVFVVDTRGALLGRVRLQDFVLGDPGRRIEEVMREDPVSVVVSEDREEAARLMKHYDLEVLPVVDHTGVMLGIVTVDDVIDVVEEEATEDFHKMASVSALNYSLKDARPSLLYRKRVGWLVLLVFANVFGGTAIAYFEETIEAVVALVFFLPLIVDSGGNAGSQSATLMVRALATGDVRMKDWLRLWGKELGVAIGLGATMALAVSVLGLWRGGTELALIVSLAMLCVVIMGSMIGMLLPFGLARFNLDPAAASAPLITSIADFFGILIYFSIATAFLTLPG